MAAKLKLDKHSLRDMIFCIVFVMLEATLAVIQFSAGEWGWGLLFSGFAVYFAFMSAWWYRIGRRKYAIDREIDEAIARMRQG